MPLLTVTRVILVYHFFVENREYRPIFCLRTFKKRTTKMKLMFYLRRKLYLLEKYRHFKKPEQKHQNKKYQKKKYIQQAKKLSIYLIFQFNKYLQKNTYININKILLHSLQSFSYVNKNKNLLLLTAKSFKQTSNMVLP
jgi:hypothetical protein